MVYILEVSLKIFAFGPRTFFESSWNRFDFLVTSVTLIGDILPLFYADSVVVSAVAPVLRLLRLLRLAKLFRELKTLMHSFASSLTALFWIAVFTLLWFYISGIICTVFMGTTEWMPDGSMGDNDAAKIRAKFATIPMSMYTLFEVMTLEGWIDVVNPVVHHRPVLLTFFLVFLFVSAFFLLNLVTAVVVNSTLEAQEGDEDAKASAEQDTQNRVIMRIGRYLLLRNKEEDTARRESVEKWLMDPIVQQELAKVNMDVELVQQMCSVIDKTSTGWVSIDGLEHAMSDTLRPLDMLTVVKMQSEMTARIELQEDLLKRLVDGSRPSEP